MSYVGGSSLGIVELVRQLGLANKLARVVWLLC